MRKKINNYYIDIYSTLQNDLNNKSILYIPVYSMREYDSGLYNLATDGNVNRFITKLSKCENVTITITIPRNVKNINFLLHHLKQLQAKKCIANFYLQYCDAYSKNASATRANYAIWNDFLEEYTKYKKADVLLFEPNCIGEINNIKKKFGNIIYWCPVSSIPNRKIKFIDIFKSIDLKNYMKYKMYVSSKKQLEIFPDAVLDNELCEPELFITSDMIEDIEYDNNKVVFFLPFRQSDEGYKIDFIYHTLEQFDSNKYIILYTAPNNFEIKNDKIIKYRFPNDRKSYYSLLAKRPTIIFLENPDEIMHASLFEFIYFNVNMIYIKNDTFEHIDKKFEIMTHNDLYTTLIEVIK